MTPMAAECAHDKCSSYFIGYFETTVWNEYNKANCFNSDMHFHQESRISIPKTADKWPPRDHFEMLALENG